MTPKQYHRYVFESRRVRALGASPASADSQFHLIEDEEEVLAMFQEDIPPEEYYEAFRKSLLRRYPGCADEFLEHCAELAEFLDVCIAVGFSLGVEKMILARRKLEVLGDIVGGKQWEMTDAKVKALLEWPPPETLKSLQEFLGTLNYSRRFIGPKYGEAVEPLRRHVQEGDASFPLSPRSLEACDRLKKLVANRVALEVPDERAAVGGWRPFEMLCDCSGVAMGAAQLQMSPELDRMALLGTFSKSLKPEQKLWTPFRQEQTAQVMARRHFRSQFGSIPTICYTDHALIVRIQELPLEQVDPVAWRANAELTADGSELRNLAGRSMRLADGIS